MDPLTVEERQARTRLQESARARGSSLAALSRLLGRNDAYLQQYVTRGSPRHLDEPDLRLIAEFLGVSTRVIETRRGRVGDGPPAGWVEVPRLSLDASAGPGSYSAEEISYDAFHFSPRWLREMGLEGAELSAIRVEGDSMEPLLRSGDEIFVDRTKRGGDGIFVVRLGEGLHVKRLRALGPDRVALISANAAYAPIEVARGEVDVIGRVVWKGGRV